jgi:hypothetical protein
VPIEKVISAIDELMKPDPQSRSARSSGARLVPLDPNRSWGWRIVNYASYRAKMDEDSRRSYRAAWMREHRRKEKRERERLEKSVNKREQGVNAREHPMNTHEQKEMGMNSREQNGQNCPGKSVNSREQREHSCTQSDSDSDKSTPCRPPKGGHTADPSTHIISVEEAKKVICQRLLNGKDSTRPWSYETMEALSRQLPIPRIEVERIAWFRGLPADGSPQLEARREITERGLLVNWSDEFSRANGFWEKVYGWAEKLEREKLKEKNDRARATT